MNQYRRGTKKINRSEKRASVHVNLNAVRVGYSFPVCRQSHSSASFARQSGRKRNSVQGPRSVLLSTSDANRWRNRHESSLGEGKYERDRQTARSRIQTVPRGRRVLFENDYKKKKKKCRARTRTHPGLEKASELRQHDTVEWDADQ
jgi:hypothetical protein